MHRLVMHQPKNLLEAIKIAWLLVTSNLKCRNDGHFLIIRKGLD